MALQNNVKMEKFLWKGFDRSQATNAFSTAVVTWIGPLTTFLIRNRDNNDNAVGTIEWPELPVPSTTTSEGVTAIVLPS